VVEYALFSKNNVKRSKKYGTLSGRPKRSIAENGTVRYGTLRGRPKRSLAENGTVRYDTLQYGTDTVDGLIRIPFCKCIRDKSNVFKSQVQQEPLKLESEGSTDRPGTIFFGFPIQK
jgi:hypothetical protein